MQLSFRKTSQEFLDLVIEKLLCNTGKQEVEV